MPTSRVLEKQKVVIDQLMKKLSLRDLEHLDKLSSEELRETVDRAIGQILYPGKVKEKLVDQLKTQITDLERFIEFLQGEQNGDDPDQCPCKNLGQQNNSGFAGKNKNSSKNPKQLEKSVEHKNLREQTIALIRHAATVLQIFAITQFGCGNQRDFQRNLLKRTARGNHWGDLRARLEIAISRVAELCQNSSAKENIPDRKCSTNSYDGALNEDYDVEVVNTVRKDLAMSLRDLLQHGLVELEPTQSLVPFGCLSTRNKNNHKQSKSMLHAWQLFLKYYQVKHGKAYSEAPARRLSMAFGLETVGGKAMTPKQTLLTAIEEVSSTHQPLKRNDDSQFKAFVCTALNQKRLVSWLRIILRSEWLVEYYYQPWSYVMKTGFDDALVSLDSLTKIEFDLPTDLAIRPFQNIRDAF